MPRRRPNLLYVMCDELRWCGLGCYGGPLARTPHLDALAARGVRCEHAVSNAPVCMPARSVVLSGQHARTCTGTANNTALRWRRDGDGRRGWMFDAYAPPQKCGFPDATLPELLRDAGYHTRAVGKWHVDAWPHEIGFDRYLIPRNHHAHSAQPFTEDGGPEFVPAGFSVDYEADRVCEFLAGDHDRPWFLYYNVSPPHMPLADMPEKYLAMFDPAEVGEILSRPNIPDGFRPSEANIRAYLWDYRAYNNYLPHAMRIADGYGLAELVALYLGATAWVDDTVGRVMSALDAAGSADDTLVVFTSDHGDMLGSHGRMGKSCLYEEGCRVPFLASGPGLPRGTLAARGVASLVDVAPTLLDAAGLDRPAHLHGTSLVPMLRGDADGPDAAVVETSEDGTGLRTLTHSYGLPRDDGNGNALADEPHRFHDLTIDPYQLAPLSPADAPDVAADLDARLRAWDAATPWLRP